MWGAIRNCSRLFGNTLETIPHYLESNRRFLNCLGTILEPFWTIRIICGLFTGYSNDFGTILGPFGTILCILGRCGTIRWYVVTIWKLFDDCLGDYWWLFEDYLGAILNYFELCWDYWKLFGDHSGSFRSTWSLFENYSWLNVLVFGNSLGTIPDHLGTVSKSLWDYSGFLITGKKSGPFEPIRKYIWIRLWLFGDYSISLRDYLGTILDYS